MHRWRDVKSFLRDIKKVIGEYLNVSENQNKNSTL